MEVCSKLHRAGLLTALHLEGGSRAQGKAGPAAVHSANADCAATHGPNHLGLWSNAGAYNKGSGPSSLAGGSGRDGCTWYSHDPKSILLNFSRHQVMRRLGPSCHRTVHI